MKAASLIKNSSIRTVAVEVASIVLAVLLALWLNEWQSNVNQTRETETALIHVREELEWNQKVITGVHEMNRLTVDSILAAQAEVEADPESAEAVGEEGEAQEQQFLPGLQAQKTAWQAFQDAGSASYADYQLILALSKTYAIQDVYRDAGLQLTQAAMNIAAFASAQGLPVNDEVFGQNLSGYLTLLVQAEEALLESYEASLQLLAEALPDAH